MRDSMNLREMSTRGELERRKPLTGVADCLKQCLYGAYSYESERQVVINAWEKGLLDPTSLEFDTELISLFMHNISKSFEDYKWQVLPKLKAITTEKER